MRANSQPICLFTPPVTSASADGLLLLGVEQHQGGAHDLVGRDDVARQHGLADHAREAHEELQRRGAVDHRLRGGLVSARFDVLQRPGEERPRVGDGPVHRPGHGLQQLDADSDVVHVVREDRDHGGVLVDDPAGGLDGHVVGHLLAFSSALACVATQTAGVCIPKHTR